MFMGIQSLQYNGNFWGIPSLPSKWGFWGNPESVVRIQSLVICLSLLVNDDGREMCNDERVS